MISGGLTPRFSLGSAVKKGKAYANKKIMKEKINATIVALKIQEMPNLASSFFLNLEPIIAKKKKKSENAREPLSKSTMENIKFNKTFIGMGITLIKA